MIFTNKLLKIINKRRRILVLVIVSAIVFGLILEKRNSQIKLQKLQLKHQHEHIEFITQENQYLLCDNERLLAMMD